MEREWNVEETMAWLLEKLRNDPGARPSSIGILVQESMLGPEDPPWDLVRQAVDRLIVSNRVSGKPQYTMPSDGSASFFMNVKLETPD